MQSALESGIKTSTREPSTTKYAFFVHSVKEPVYNLLTIVELCPDTLIIDLNSFVLVVTTVRYSEFYKFSVWF